MAKYKVINNIVNDNLVGLQFATDGGTPLFTIGNFQIDTTIVEKQNKTYDIGQSSQYFTLDDIGQTNESENVLRDNKTKLTLNPDYTDPRSYSYFGPLKEYFRVNIEQIIRTWPASIYVDNVFDSITGNTVEDYNYNPVTNRSTFKVNNSFFVNSFDIKYLNEYTTNEGLDNSLRNLVVEYGKYVISYNQIEYPIIGFTGSTSISNDYVYFDVDGISFDDITGSTLSTKYHIKPNDIEVEKFFSSLSDLAYYLLNRYIYPAYTIKFNYLAESDQGPYDIFLNKSYTWPVIDGYNIDIVSNLFDTYITSVYDFCTYFDENDTNILNRRLVSESINRLNTIRRADGSEDENEAEKVSKLINIYAREFDEVKKYIDGVSYVRNVTYDKKKNSPDSLVKDLSKTLGWSMLNPMSDVDLISSFIPTQSVFSGYTVNYSKYDAEIEFWRRIIINSAHLWRSKGARKAIEFIFDLIGTPEQLVNFNEHVYIAKKPINMDLFKLIVKELTGFDDIDVYNVDEDGFPKILPPTPYNFYQSNGLWYRETSGTNSSIDVLDGNNPHIGVYDGGKNFLDQFRCLVPQFSATSINIINEYVEFTNLFKNYSNGLINNYNGQIYLNSYSIDGKPNLCYTITGTAVTSPDPQYILNLCGCPLSLSENSLFISFEKNNNFQSCGSNNSICGLVNVNTINNPPIHIFSGLTNDNVQLVSKTCCTSNLVGNSSQTPTWVEINHGLGYCFWDTVCKPLKLITSSNGEYIFYNTDTGATGKTSSELDESIENCCSYFGGEFDPDSGICKVVNPNNLVQTNRPVASSESNENPCQLTLVKDINGNIVLNSDGTVNFVNSNNVLSSPTSECCVGNSTQTLPLTFCGGKCYWVDNDFNCDTNNDVKISLGVDGNDGVFLYSGANENCYFQVEFDMLINFDCSKFVNCVGQNNILNLLSGFTINSTIESATGNTSTTLQSYPAFSFNISNKPTGIYFSGNESICNSLNNQILLELGDDCKIVTEDTISSKWVNIKFNISNEILNQKVKVGFEFNNIPCDFNFLLDNIKINRLCIISNEDIINLTNCIGFDIDRIIDNKKSWDYTETRTLRFNESLDYRDTNYYENDSRLLINSKEVDLTLDPAKAIENDLFCYIRKNDCFFTGNTGTTITDPYLIQYKSEIDLINTVTEFREFVLTRLIDVKSRQVINSYPLLRYMYDKYLNLCGLNNCENLGNQYNYDTLQDFVKLIGDYWINLVEQLVPSTSIWKGATKYYRNTVFDQPKFKYKNYSLLTCNPDCTTILSGDTTCEVSINSQNYFDLGVLVEETNSNILNNITNCWTESLFNENLLTEDSSNLPPSILECISSSGNSINSGTISVNASILGVPLFNELILSGTSINELSGNTNILTMNSILNGFTGAGYTILYTGNTYSIISPNLTDCGKSIDIDLCLNLDLSCVSGGTYPNNVEERIVVESLSPKDMVLNTLSGTIYVSNSSYIGKVFILDTLTNSLSQINNVGYWGGNITYNSVNNTIYTLSSEQNNNSTGSIYVIDCTTNTISTTIPLNVSIINCDIQFNSTNNTVYVTDYYNNEIYVIDCTTNVIIQTITSGNIINPNKMVYDSNNNRIYCFMDIVNSVLVLDCTNPLNTTILSTIPLQSNRITDLVFDSVNNKVYIVNNGNTGGVDIIDTNLNLLINTFNYGELYTSIEYCSTHNTLYLTNGNRDYIDIFSLNTLSTLERISNISSSVTKSIYYPMNNKFYMISQKMGITILESLGGSITLNTNCSSCERIFSGTFQEVINNSFEIFDCEKCVGYENNVEVIIEPILLYVGTGNTENTCVEVNNKTICSKVFIKSINNDVTFKGTINNIMLQ